MGVRAITAVALTVFLAACAGPQLRASPDDDLSTSETEFHSSQRILPLPVATTSADTLYRNPMLAIDVLEVLADGHPVTAVPSLVLFVGIDTSAITVQNGTYIYHINLDRLLFWKQPNQSLVEYSIPEAAEVLVIRYRLVPYDGNPASRVYTLTARRAG